MTPIEIALSIATTLIGIIGAPSLFIARDALARLKITESMLAGHATAIAVANERHTSHAGDIGEIKAMVRELGRKMDRLVATRASSPESDPP